MNPETKICKNCQTQFLIEPDDFTFYEKIGLPAQAGVPWSPTFCPPCRYQRRLMYRNERSYYKRTCSLCKKDTIALYPADFETPVVCQKCWWSDTWDPFQYGRDFDFSRPFFEQFAELFHAVPMLALQNDDGIGSVNCQYNSDFAFSKNCYMCTCGWYNENCAHTSNANYNKDLLDSYITNKSVLSYECSLSDNCYGCAYCTKCFDSRNCFLGYDLRGCSDCVMCVGLRSKTYCILNQQYSREEYLKRVEEMHLERAENIERYRVQFKSFMLKFPHRFAHILKSVASTGDMLMNCKNSKNCFYFRDLENCKYMISNDGAKDCYDCNNTGKPTLCYEGATPDNSYGCIATIFSWKCNKAEYSNNCHSASNVFGCSALKSAEYAILNKRYSKEEYIELRGRIIEHMKTTGEWGEFFPPGMSPFAYNESNAYDLFRLTEEEAKAKGYRWKNFEEKNYQITVPVGMVPATIAEVPDTITNDIIGCAHRGQCLEKCTTAFRVTSQEFQFYKKTKLPLPRLCPNCRYYERFALINPPQLWHRKCSCGGAMSENNAYSNTQGHSHADQPCLNEFETSYSPDRPEIVYCEQCYQSEVS